MCSNAERLEILIILHICLFLTSYDSSNSRLGEMETIVTSNQSRELYCNLSLGKFDFYLNYSSHNLYIGLHSQSVRIRWWLMKHSQGILMLEVTQPLLCFWINLVFVSSPTILGDSKILLIENEEIINESTEVANVFNSYFESATESLNLFNWATEPYDQVKDSVDRIVQRFSLHPSIIKIKQNIKILKPFHSHL